MSNPADLSQFRNHRLPDGISLQVIDADGTLLFEASGKWLHPLFSLEHFLETRKEVDPEMLFLHDRIAGKAAAALTVRLGFRTVKADMISALALDLYGAHGVNSFFDTKVDRIECMTETLLAGIDDIHEIYRVIEERRRVGRRVD